LRKYLITATTALVVLAVAAVALAQYPLPTLTFTATATPTKAGTKKKPKNTKIHLKITVPKEARATADSIVFNLPGDMRVSGKGFAFCPSTELATTKNPAKCPKGSKVGTGTATAAFGPNLTPITFDVQLFAGATTELGIWLQARGLPIQKAIRGVVSRAGRPYYNKVTIILPPDLQKQLGAFVYITGLDATIGATNGKKGKKLKNLITTVGCPKDKKHRWEARMTFVPNPDPPQQGQSNQGATSACK
jgi:hypothetical protein